MTQDAWPSPDGMPGPLPRIEDLPSAVQGYDPEAVRLAFDSFYRHAAQLDASLRALEAVEVFRRDADALRNDLRALRALGVGRAEPAWGTAPQPYELRRFEVPAVVLRLAAEVALIVAVAVIAAVAHLRPAVVVALMASAFVIVALVEWLAGHGRFVPPPLGFLPTADEGEPAPFVEALTFVASAEEVEAASVPVDAEPIDAESIDAESIDPWEQGMNGEPGEPEQPRFVSELAPEGEDDREFAGRPGLFRRRRR